MLNSSEIKVLEAIEKAQDKAEKAAYDAFNYARPKEKRDIDTAVKYLLITDCLERCKDMDFADFFEVFASSEECAKYGITIRAFSDFLFKQMEAHVEDVLELENEEYKNCGLWSDI